VKQQKNWSQQSGLDNDYRFIVNRIAGFIDVSSTIRSNSPLFFTALALLSLTVSLTVTVPKPH
jgi:hypothetical protein